MKRPSVHKGWELFDGLMLSDAQLVMGRRSVNPYFSAGFSGAKHLPWLTDIKESLKRVGILFADKYPRLYKCTSKGKSYIKAVLDSRSMPLLAAQYRRWYEGGSKIVPADLAFTPVVLAYWFMGDGSSSYKRSQHTLPGNTSVEIGLATHGFTLREVDYLVGKLGVVGFMSVTKHAAGKNQLGQYGVHIGRAEDVVEFMRTVEPYLAPIFSYKVKYPKLSRKAV